MRVSASVVVTSGEVVARVFVVLLRGGNWWE